MAYTTINKSTDYFNTKLYTGSGSAQSLTGVGFQPDWIWIKNRSYADHHKVVDRVRWVSSSNSAQLSTNQNSAAGTQAIITSFDSDGFTLTTGDRGWNSSNGDNFVSWNWKANGQGSSNTDGTINTTYTSANTTAGFSISQYTGTGSNATIGHGLGAAPKLVIIKKTNTTADWLIGQEGLGGWNYVLNFSVSGRADQSAQFQSTAPSSSLITLGTDGQVNGSGATYICYAFAPKTGFSKFGSYQGNGQQSDNAFVYTGFKPALVIIKRRDQDTNWVMFDTARDTYNEGSKVLLPDNSAAETSGSQKIDFLSNGFKIRSSGNNTGDSSPYIYMCFAEAPLVGSNNVPATAR